VGRVPLDVHDRALLCVLESLREGSSPHRGRQPSDVEVGHHRVLHAAKLSGGTDKSVPDMPTNWTLPASPRDPSRVDVPSMADFAIAATSTHLISWTKTVRFQTKAAWFAVNGSSVNLGPSSSAPCWAARRYRKCYS